MGSLATPRGGKEATWGVETGTATIFRVTVPQGGRRPDAHSTDTAHVWSENEASPSPPWKALMLIRAHPGGMTAGTQPFRLALGGRAFGLPPSPPCSAARGGGLSGGPDLVH